MLASLPADLATQTRFVAGSLDVVEPGEEFKKNSFDEIPIFGAAGKETAKPEFFAFALVDVDHGEIALATGGDIETEAERRAAVERGGPHPRSLAHLIGEGNALEKRKEALVDEIANFLLTPAGIARIEFAELLEDLIVFEVDANNFVVVTA